METFWIGGAKREWVESNSVMQIEFLLGMVKHEVVRAGSGYGFMVCVTVGMVGGI